MLKKPVINIRQRINKKDAVDHLFLNIIIREEKIRMIAPVRRYIGTGIQMPAMIPVINAVKIKISGLRILSVSEMH
jgi:hypothetical protein